MGNHQGSQGGASRPINAGGGGGGGTTAGSAQVNGGATSHTTMDPESLPQLKRGFSLRRSRRLSKRFRSHKSMDRLRRSFRESFRRKKDVAETCSPQLWAADEVAVRQGDCSFHVKYLGALEVFESRGMTVCEEALKTLRNSRKRPVKGVLFVTGDGLRVVDDETKDLILDQTIEKVSFCAPDRNHEKGFSYICRDGTTRRWMCHGFQASRDSGERLSHAVGCAFAVCLERKQQRDRESKEAALQAVTLQQGHQDQPGYNVQGGQGNVTSNGSSGGNNTAISTTATTTIMTTTRDNNNFRRAASMRCTSSAVRAPLDPQECKPSQVPPVKAVVNPYAIERPHATPSMLERQNSFRGLATLGAQSPFKRQLSLRLNDLPSNRQRQRSMSLDTEATQGLVREAGQGALGNPAVIPEGSPLGSQQALSDVRVVSAANPLTMQGVNNPLSVLSTSLPQQATSGPLSLTGSGGAGGVESSLDISAMCQQLSMGLDLLSSDTGKCNPPASNALPDPFDNNPVHNGCLGGMDPLSSSVQSRGDSSSSPVVVAVAAAPLPPSSSPQTTGAAVVSSTNPWAQGAPGGKRPPLLSSASVVSATGPLGRAQPGSLSPPPGAGGGSGSPRLAHQRAGQLGQLRSQSLCDAGRGAEPGHTIDILQRGCSSSGSGSSSTSSNNNNGSNNGSHRPHPTSAQPRSYSSTNPFISDLMPSSHPAAQGSTSHRANHSGLVTSNSSNTAQLAQSGAAAFEVRL